VRVLEDLRVRGEPVALCELAARLVASPSPLDPRLARPIVAAALALAPASLPDPIPAAALVAPPDGACDETPLERAAFAVVDLETTGLSPLRAAIIEIGAVRVSALRVAGRFETLVHPGRPVPRGITALTGIDDRMLAGAPSAPAALLALRRWLDAEPDAPFVAHNAGFDASFVGRGFRRWGLAPLGPVLCTRRLARRVVPELRRFGLDQLASGFGIRNRARHRALGDALATAEALLHLLQRARERHAVRTLGDLVRLEAGPPPRKEVVP
jgi:DNA polymerase-3 subunit epsilon